MRRGSASIQTRFSTSSAIPSLPEPGKAGAGMPTRAQAARPRSARRSAALSRHRPLDQALPVDPRRPGAGDAPALAGHPRGEVGLGRRLRALAQEHGGGEERRQPLDEPARLGLRRLAGPGGGEVVHRPVVARASGRARRRARPRGARGPACPCASVRSTSRQITFPEPSQIEFERRLAVEQRQRPLLDIAHRRRGTPSPRRSSRGQRLLLRNLASATATRAKARSSSSKARATRRPSASALSTSSARSASTLAISGCSISRRWKARRPLAHQSASESAARISPAGASAVSRRVWCTISMMVRTPPPGSPSASAKAPAYSISAEALARLPSLSLSRISRMALRSPSGVQRGTRKQVSPAGRLRQRQEGVRHRRRAEPLVPGQPPALAVGLGAGGVGAHVRAALLLGHRHADRRARLLRRPAAPPDRSGRRGPAAPRPPSRPDRRRAPAPRHRSSSSGSRRPARPGSACRPWPRAPRARPDPPAQATEG